MAKVTQKMTDAEYHARSKRGEYMSSHMLMKFISNPVAYKYAIGHAGEIADDCPAFAFGRAFHCVALEPERFQRDYTVSDGPLNPKTGKPYGKSAMAYAEWLAKETQAGREVISPADYDTLNSMYTGLQTYCPELQKDGETEQIYEAELYGVKCQIKCDLFVPQEKLLIDLKTCSELAWFEHDFRKYQYGVQIAFYLMVLEECGFEGISPRVIAVEKNAPFCAGTLYMSDGYIAKQKAICRLALENVKACREMGAYINNFEEMMIEE